MLEDTLAGCLGLHSLILALRVENLTDQLRQSLEHRLLLGPRVEGRLQQDHLRLEHRLAFALEIEGILEHFGLILVLEAEGSQRRGDQLQGNRGNRIGERWRWEFAVQHISKNKVNTS